MPFDTLLVANRGEIACRIVRTARRMGLRTVAVHSDADAGARHVAMADTAVRIGPAPARESYLDPAAVIAAARASGAQAVHPGYGFLSENAAFAEACAAAGLVFVGPPPAAIRAMGGKSEAKALMQAAGVPTVPGYHGDDQDPARLAAEADRIGWPVLIKASAGGGGTGMRAVTDPARFADELAGARREAAAAFGDDRVLIERYLACPRHVEIQVFADAHGNAVHLFERDCSIQRRHQKVVEEAPAPGMDPDLRRRMGEAAVTAARAIGYVGAGTIEFLLDADGSFFFMEMNTRLQVEHPVTEMITGQDLVAWQLRVAAGEPLPLGQDDLAIRGHAIEVRLYAEDPQRDFLPQTGRLDHLRFPAEDAHVRVDTGVRPGDAISIHYDPMIAKIVVWDGTRAGAVRRLSGALAATQVGGLATNAAFLAAIAAHPAFAAADLDTRFIERHRADLLPPPGPAGSRDLALAALAVVAARPVDVADPWSRPVPWRLNEPAWEEIVLRDGETERRVTVVHAADGLLVRTDAGEHRVAGSAEPDGTLVATIDGLRETVAVIRAGDALTLFRHGGAVRLVVVDPLAGGAADEAGGGRLASPMPGKVVAVLAEAGQAVVRGQPLLVLEAMKMEHTIRAPADGRVVAVCYRPGDQVSEGEDLIGFEAGDGATTISGG
ncbi:MAG: acetyl/propionyl/methylcrotonyl-CoA carboxylase subunit alpha [Rhodospirillales bacterium]